MPCAFIAAAQLMVGGALPLLLRRSPALRAALLNWQVLVLAAFEALVVTPISTFLLCTYPQWSLLYVFDPQLYPQLEMRLLGISALGVLLNFALLLTGYAWARSGILQGRRRRAWGPVGLGLGIQALGLALFAERIAYVGDFDSFWQGQAARLQQRSAGWLSVLLVAATLGLLVSIWQRFRRADPRFI